jgi:hypothetical protein
MTEGAAGPVGSLSLFISNIAQSALKTDFLAQVSRLITISNIFLLILFWSILNRKGCKAKVMGSF